MGVAPSAQRCAQCGNEQASDDRFCRSCGTLLTAAGAGSTVLAAAPEAGGGGPGGTVLADSPGAAAAPPGAEVPAPHDATAAWLPSSETARDLTPPPAPGGYGTPGGYGADPGGGYGAPAASPGGYLAATPGYGGWTQGGPAADPGDPAPTSRLSSGYPSSGTPYVSQSAVAQQQARSGDVRRPRGMIVATIVLAAAIVASGAYIGLRILHSPAPAPSGSHSPAAGSGAAPASSSPAASTSPGGAVTEQQAAQNLSQLLQSSVSDREAINSAYSDVMSCGPSLSQDATTFQQAASSRQQLLSQLASMPGLSALPAPMITSLQQAWQSSMTVDQDYATWASDEDTPSCAAGTVTSDSSFQAANGPNQAATQSKTAFVGQWNPIASQYGLTPYAQDQL